MYEGIFVIILSARVHIQISSYDDRLIRYLVEIGSVCSEDIIKMCSFFDFLVAISSTRGINSHQIESVVLDCHHARFSVNEGRHAEGHFDRLHSAENDNTCIPLSPSCFICRPRHGNVVVVLLSAPILEIWE